MNPEVTAYIENAPEPQKEIMQLIRRILLETLPGVREEFKWSRPVFALNKDFAYLKTTKSHLTLGFYNFQKINDPENLLEGIGKDLRHIKLKKMEDVNIELLKGWFVAVTQE